MNHGALKKIEGVDYYNTGDWVESCTALVEKQDGSIELIHWLEHPLQFELGRKKKEKIMAKKRARETHSVTAGI